MTRKEHIGKNVIWQAISTGTLTLLNFIARYIFVKTLGAEYLGVESLFNSVLSVLSFVDIGFASAFTFCFYKAIASDDEKHVILLLSALRKIFYTIMIAISCFGFCLIPFLDVLIKGNQVIDHFHVVLYYILMVANTVIGYLFMYKTCYITALQKAYILVPFTVIANILIAVVQIGLLAVFRNYTMYLGSGIVARLIQAFVLNKYICKHFPETKQITHEPIDDEDKNIIKRNLKGIFISKLATVCVYQTDNIIISAGINIVATGVSSNYLALKTAAASILSLVQNAIVPAMGDLICKEKKEVQLHFFYTYLMLMSYLSGLAFCGLSILSTPIVQLLFGGDMTIDGLSVFFMNFALFISFMTYSLNILPTAGGHMNVGAYIGFVEGIGNVVISVIAMRFMGLSGVFLGTMLSALIAYILRPISVFPKMYSMSPIKFFCRNTISCAITFVAFFELLFFQKLFWDNITNLFFKIGIAFCAVIIIYTLNFYLFWRKDVHFKHCIDESMIYINNLRKKGRE